MCIKFLSFKKYCVSFICLDYYLMIVVIFVFNKMFSIRENYKNSNIWEWECIENLKIN